MPGPTLAFGKHSSDEILRISQATNGNNCHCTCPECDLHPIARTKHVTRHFAHRPEAGFGTTGEMTALHSFARDMFLNGVRLELPAMSQDGHCFLGLTDVELTDVRTEERFDGYRPDVVFTASGKPRLMELAVTHMVPLLNAGLIRGQKSKLSRSTLNWIRPRAIFPVRLLKTTSDAKPLEVGFSTKDWKIIFTLSTTLMVFRHVAS